MAEDTANARALRLDREEALRLEGSEQEEACEEVRTQATGQNM